MFFAEGFLPNCERSFVIRFGLVVFALWDDRQYISELKNPPDRSTTQ